MRLPTTLTWAFLLLSPLATAARPPKDSVLLSKIASLTLRAGSLTTSRRTSPVPQLECIGGNAHGLYEVDIMRCTNSGSDYDDASVQWTCKASLPPEFKLGATDVVCEGFSGPEDPYVLKGSCGVEYRLVLTEEGERRYGHRDDGEGGMEGNSTFDRVVFGVCVLFIGGVVAYGIWDCCTNPRNRTGGPRGGDGRGGWGGGGGDDNDDGNDPPPPYTPRYDPYGKNASNTSAGSNQAAAQGYRPGFWTGAGAGGLAGLAAGTAGNWFANRNATNLGNRRGEPVVAGPSRPPNRNYGSAWGGGGRDSSPPQPSSSRYESTGFGETRRR